MQLYFEKFLNKPIEPEYYVDKTAEIDLRVKFLKPFANHKLLKFIHLNKKFKPHYVKAFYCNLELTVAEFLMWLSLVIMTLLHTLVWNPMGWVPLLQNHLIMIEFHLCNSFPSLFLIRLVWRISTLAKLSLICGFYTRLLLKFSIGNQRIRLGMMILTLSNMGTSFRLHIWFGKIHHLKDSSFQGESKQVLVFHIFCSDDSGAQWYCV